MNNDNRVGSTTSSYASKGIGQGVTPTTPIKADTRGIEGKLIRLIESTMDRGSFDTPGFAYLLSLMPPHIQAVFMQSFLAYTDTMRHKLDTDTYEIGEYPLCIQAMRIQEGIGKYPSV